MLTEERYAAILAALDEKKAVTVLELTKLLNTSESTIRRDLTLLHKSGKLYKVYGGATTTNASYITQEENFTEKIDLHKIDKQRIAKAAANCVERNDFVYIDAGTTTAFMIDYLTETTATYVTNGILHANKLVVRGLKAFILGGQIKSATIAVTGIATLTNLQCYNFTKGFFGANGISITAGFSTPDSCEGLVKSEALKRCKTAYVLADPAKFNRISPITFATISSATILTTVLLDKKYKDYTKIIEVNNHDLHGNL